MTEHAWNPWTLTTIGIGLAAAVALVTGVVVANWTGREAEPTASVSVTPPRPGASTAARVVAAPQPAPAPVAAPQSSAVPSQAAIDACNQQAAAQSSQTSKTVEVLKDGAIGAAIGAVVGAGGGALYGVNENRKNDQRYRDAYAGCLPSRGYTS